MTDHLTPEARSALMAKIRSTNTGPERAVRSILHRMGYRFSLHRKNLPGSPDIVLAKYRTVILVHGCFWHRHKGCRDMTIPATRKAFWKEKFERNVARDQRNLRELRQAGWKTIVVWECELRKPEKLEKKLRAALAPTLRTAKSRPGSTFRVRGCRVLTRPQPPANFRDPSGVVKDRIPSTFRIPRSAFPPTPPLPRAAEAPAPYGKKKTKSKRRA